MARLTKTGDAMSDESEPDNLHSLEDDDEAHDTPSIFGNKLPSSPEPAEEPMDFDEAADVPKPSDAVEQPEPKTSVRRAEPLTFMSFPHEVKQKVYERALIADGSVYICSAPDDHDLTHWNDITLQSSIGIYDYEQKQAIAAVTTSKITPALAHLHRSLVTSVQEVLYRNKFSIRGFLTAARFFTQIGQNRALLSNVEILEADVPEEVEGATAQFVVGLLADAALNLKHLHLGMDVAAPFVDDPDDRARFLDEKPARTRKMAKHVLPCVTRIFRIRHQTTGETAKQFIDKIFSVHPASFDPDGQLPRDPFLKWEDEAHFTCWGDSLAYHDFLASSSNLRQQLRPLLEAEGRIKVRRHKEWNSVESGSK